MILILTGINLLTYFKGKVTTMLVANSRELRFIIIGSDFKWESITAAWGDRYGVGDVAREEHKALARDFYFEQKYFAGFASSLQT